MLDNETAMTALSVLFTVGALACAFWLKSLARKIREAKGIERTPYNS